MIIKCSFNTENVCIKKRTKLNEKTIILEWLNYFKGSNIKTEKKKKKSLKNTGWSQSLALNINIYCAWSIIISPTPLWSYFKYCLWYYYKIRFILLQDSYT